MNQTNEKINIKSNSFESKLADSDIKNNKDNENNQFIINSIKELNFGNKSDFNNYHKANGQEHFDDNSNNNTVASNIKKNKAKNNFPKKGKSMNHSKNYKELLCEKCGEKPTQYGLLTECDHIFCLECIKKIWRVPESDSEKFSHKCPICNVPSFHFIPSDIYCHSGPLKKHIIDRFRTRCSRISCKFYERVRHDGSHYCPFGQMCLFAHKNSNGVDIKKLESNYEQNNDIAINNDLSISENSYSMNNYDKFSNTNNYSINSIPVKTCYNINEQYIPILKSNKTNTFNDKVYPQCFNQNLMLYLNINENNVNEKFNYNNNNYNN
ncbi:hypothetical protein BCR36DRAFT_415540 [Piromyces finnis]|uniref:Uncharacterized protein n=1 Tax=Piromyces finnis TaxID=1754191 RepID=A0A1Y1UY94_9FUNG|nr:hypothetical protein BCR36DRAFT_415540 [Piromyces finnis]|eukprot:ORX43355.1 hypothetical protein BCR36DRAFT_415540 [Piromyces finnis]